MTIGQYKTQIDEIRVFLNKFNFLLNYSKDNLFNSATAKRLSRLKKYGELYSEIYSSGEYTFQLFDNSLLQFSYNKDPLVLGYSFIPFPFEFPSYIDYLLINNFEYEEVGDQLMEEYEQNASSFSTAKEHINIIRYDYSEKEYSDSVHSISHIHVGFENIRISSEKILDPMTFFIFILKQVYIEIWKKNISNPDFYKCCQHKKMCQNIQKKFFSKKDQDELYLV